VAEPVANELTLRRHFVIGLVSLATFFLSASACAQDYPVPGMEDACIEALGYLGCENLNHPGGGAQQLVPLYWAALAISPTTMRAGGAHGRNSQDEAEQTAMQNCRRNGAKDCKILNWGRNFCVSLAVSYADKSLGYNAASDRNSAASGALEKCRAYHGKSCVVILAPCADDDVRWSSPLPLPTEVQGGKVDTVMVGTWEMVRNPGRWIWRVTANGTYEFHSEAVDNTPSNAGTLTASGGHYTLHAITTQWDDVGTYVVQSPTVVVATGRLGTGTWKRIAP
jgi:hypothetical protein